MSDAVPCNGCTLCCRNDMLMLHPEGGDIVADYETETTVNPVTGRVGVMLKHQSNGDCVYLSRKTGCTIYDRRPLICREFDCRRFYLKIVEQTSRQERKKFVKNGLLSNEVLRAGRQRLDSLP